MRGKFATVTLCGVRDGRFTDESYISRMGGYVCAI